MEQTFLVGQMGEPLGVHMWQDFVGTVKASLVGTMGEFLELYLLAGEFLEGQVWKALVGMVKASLVGPMGRFFGQQVCGFLLD